MDDGKIDTYQVNGAKSISHSIYVDDILIFSKADPKSLNSIKGSMELLGVFSRFSLGGKEDAYHMGGGSN